MLNSPTCHSPVSALLRRSVLALCFVLPIATAIPSVAGQMVSVDVGYFNTTSSKFGNGLAYGLGLTEGSGKIGFGITALRFSNTYKGDTTTVTPEGKIFTTELEETVNDFFITILATYRHGGARGTDRIILGAGPQVHLVNSHMQIGDLKFSGRSSRLGFGLIFRYHRRIEMFGEAALALTGAYSYVHKVAAHTDQYEPPREAFSLATLTVGLAFPF
jgi:hypothetical protein